jgi:hypothetical protein
LGFEGASITDGADAGAELGIVGTSAEEASGHGAVAVRYAAIKATTSSIPDLVATSHVAQRTPSTAGAFPSVSRTVLASLRTSRTDVIESGTETHSRGFAGSGTR